MWHWFSPLPTPSLLSPSLLILRCQGIHHFSPQKQKQLVVKLTKNRSVRRYQNTHIWAYMCAHTVLLLVQLHKFESSTVSRMPIVLLQPCSTSLMIAQIPLLPYTTLRGGEICQTVTGPLLTSHTTIFDSQLGNCKIKGLGKWKSVTQWRESKQTLPWELVEEEWTRCALRRKTKVK